MTQPATVRQVLVESLAEIHIDRVPAPVAGISEVLVRSTMVGICGSDLHAAHGRHPFIDLPYRPGHEVVGVVEALGAGVDEVKVGDRVVVEPNLYCGTCPQCLAGRYNICRNLAVFGCQTAGGMAERFSVPADRLHKLPDSLPDRSAVLAEPLATAVHAVSKAGDLRGCRVLVLGAGPIGLLVLLAAKRAGAELVAVTDLLPTKRQRAQRLGADAAIPADAPDLAIRANAALSGPADFVFDCVANEQTMAQAVDSVDKGGTILVVGVPQGPVSVRLDLVQDHEITVAGNLMYVAEDMRTALDMLRTGGVDVDELVTATFPLDSAAEAFAAADDPEQVKVLVTVP
ncbi:MAG TPA: alcohol dehydrogenase catalytic domain-containing protein [Pseudonocardiaceae bacterium]|jgi:2-desacetyl-2-hydroxyethyl bacteriochlorophyllide A dehydrogenase|nr:alcohol dehydrogenase catalytic domain-containing protein [Pseudonocardiaceae bacterium]